ncbi:MAG: hypothetical protein KF690_00890 [Bacteroidetes bacterium]|nr:hypothetical protein [Bacteroidota bacterium]
MSRRFLFTRFPEPWQRRALLGGFVLAFALITWRATVVPLGQAGNPARNMIRGDAYSDINTLSAARFFRDYGFGETYLLPVFKYPGHGMRDTIMVYTHYPALPDVLAGLSAQVLGADDDRNLRVLPILLAMVLYGYMAWLLVQWLPQPRMAVAGTLVVALSHYFVFFADTYHKHLYEELFVWLCTGTLWVYYTRGRRWPWLALAGLWMVLAVNASFEPIVFLAIVVAGFSLLYTRRLLTVETLLLGAVCVCGFVLHLWQVRLYMGSWEAMWHEMFTSLQVRSQGVGAGGNELGRSLMWYDYLKVPFDWLNRIERLFLLPGWALAGLSVWAMRRQWVRGERRLFWLGVILLLAGMGWSLVMAQHFIVHLFTTRHMGMFLALMAGYALPLYVDTVRAHFARRNLPWQIFHVLFIGYMLVMACTQQLADWYCYGFGYSG